MIPPSTPLLPRRNPEGHKGTFGTVIIVGGTRIGAVDPAGKGVDEAVGEAANGGAARAKRTMVGGPALAALAAFRTGTGLVTLMMPQSLLMAGLTICPSATGVGILEGADSGTQAGLADRSLRSVIEHATGERVAVVIGPGLGMCDGAKALVRAALAQEKAAVVLDADALNVVAMDPVMLLNRRAEVVLTPHAGEAHRLVSMLGDPENAVASGCANEAKAEDVVRAQHIARAARCVVVHKSATTIITDGERTHMHEAPNPALGAGGSGDVLAGTIASLIAQHLGEGENTRDAMQCAIAGVTAHSSAAAAWTNRCGATGGMLAQELADELPLAVEALR